MNIYVMDRGFVLVGEEVATGTPRDAMFITLNRWAVVRRWGTTQGLGELATFCSGVKWRRCRGMGVPLRE
jgi:hypothetical protein